MVENSIIDFLMEQLAHPATCPRKIRQAVKTLIEPGTSIGRRMLTDQLIDCLFDLYAHGLADTVELGMALKAKLNRYLHVRFQPVRQSCTVLPLRPPSLKFSM
ncbi:MAG: hypothetical protein QM647_18330 [Asticcacaulis sp.]|uniref:hypothetical protein n=1 Tax=Asticcacaulis sp. TaxID=1872648 RepID=UPI0039E60B4A